MVGLLEDLAARGIELWTEGDRLRFRASEGALTPPLREALASRKAEVIAALRERLSNTRSYHTVSYNQRSMWFLHNLAPTSAAYNLAFAARIYSTIDMPSLHGALQALIDRHATLRTTYEVVDEELRQVVHGCAGLTFIPIDASGWNDATLHEEVSRHHRDPFDLQHGPVFRVSLFTRRDDEHVLLLSLHHIAVDGWSTWILLDELATLYAARANKLPVVLPRSAVEYTDYAAAQSAQLAGPEGESLWKYWQDKLAGTLPVLQLPLDRPRPPLQTFSGASCTQWLSRDLQTAVDRLAKTEGATSFVTLLAAYFALLHSYSGQIDIIVGSPTLGRNRSEYENLVGDCIGMVALRVDLSGDPTFTELLDRVRHTVAGALDHQDYPFPLMVERLAHQRDFSRSPVFQTVFMYQRPQRLSSLTELFTPDQTLRRVDFGGLVLEAYSLPQQEGQFDLVLELVEIGEALAATTKHNTDLFDMGMGECLLEHYVSLLERVAADPALRLSALALPTPEGKPLPSQLNDSVVECFEDEERDVFEI